MSATPRAVAGQSVQPVTWLHTQCCPLTSRVFWNLVIFWHLFVSLVGLIFCFHMPLMRGGGGGGGVGGDLKGVGVRGGSGGRGLESGQIAEILSTRSTLAVLSFCIELNTQCF